MLPPCLNESIRRQDRVVDESVARRLLAEGEYGFLSMQATGGGGYGVPVNFVWDEAANAVYFHGAPQGRKLLCMAAEPRVTFCIVGNTRPIGEKFTTEYESVLLPATARTGLGEEDRLHALKLLIAKYSAGHEEVGLQYARASFHRTEIVRLDLHGWSAKGKSVPYDRFK